MSKQRNARPASPKKAAAARANGAKSQGPVSPEGKDRSSQNSIRHGCYAQAVLLGNEDPDAWGSLLGDFITRFHPIGQVELGLVEEMAAAHWRIRRYWFAESASLDNEMHRQKPALDKEFLIYSEPSRIAHAMETLATSQSQILQLFHRLESRLRRHYSRALADLLTIQQLRLAPPPIAKNDETNPPPPEPPTTQPLAETPFIMVPNTYVPPPPPPPITIQSRPSLPLPHPLLPRPEPVAL